MTGRSLESSAARRSFIGRLASGVAGLGAAIGLGAPSLQAQSGQWQPARHEQDDWLDKLPGKHRLIFDTTTPDGFGQGLAFANNFFNVNQSGYGLQNGDLAVVIVVRHLSTPCGFNDAMWAKYGSPMALQAGLPDPKTRQAPKINVYNSADYGIELPNRSVTIESLAKRGLVIAVCQVATRGYATTIANVLGGNVDAIYTELTSNLVSNSRMVPAGIVAVNRAQERGYSLARA